jgi:release factor glutamine methyltransferase
MKENLTVIRESYRKMLAPYYEKKEIDAIFSLAVEHVCGYDLTQQLMQANEPVTHANIAELNHVLNRLKNHEPIQYILGQCAFYGLNFRVNRHVLIPRQETELLVDQIIKNRNREKFSVLDIGTGSGCIIISLKKNIPDILAEAIDISREALEVAMNNAFENRVSVTFHHADILDSSLTLNSYDVIVSNPPYVRELEKIQMHSNVVDYEPQLALFVPDNEALKYYISIARFAKSHLNDEGTIWLEINEALADETSSVFQKHGFSKTDVIQDLNGKDRILKIHR